MIVDTDVSPVSQVGGEKLDIALNPATGLSGVAEWQYTPGFQFQITRCKAWCRVKTGTVTVTLVVQGRTAASLTFTGGSENNATLSTTLANIRGSKTEAIQLIVTTDGTGNLAGGHVVLEFRPWPMAGESAPGDAAGPLRMG